MKDIVFFQEAARRLRAAMEDARVRKTDDRKISVIDLIMAETGKGRKYASETLIHLLHKYPELQEGVGYDQFPGQGQRLTPIVNLENAIQIALLLPGKRAAQLRREAAVMLLGSTREDALTA